MYIHKATVTRALFRGYKWTDFYGVRRISPTLPTERDVLHPVLIAPLTAYATVSKELPGGKYTTAVVKDLDDYHRSLEQAKDELQTEWQGQWDGTDTTLTIITVLLLDVEITRQHIKGLLQSGRVDDPGTQVMISTAIQPLDLDRLLTIHGNQ